MATTFNDIAQFLTDQEVLSAKFKHQLIAMVSSAMQDAHRRGVAEGRRRAASEAAEKDEPTEEAPMYKCRNCSWSGSEPASTTYGEKLDQVTEIFCPSCEAEVYESH